MRNRVVAILSLAAAFPCAAGPPYLLDLGEHLPRAISDDGRVIAIPRGQWTDPAAGLGGLVFIPPPFEYAHGISGDGRVVIGGCESPIGADACKWTDPAKGGAGVVSLNIPAGDGTVALAASHDGRIIVGYEWAPLWAFMWDDPAAGGVGLVWLPWLPGSQMTWASDVSSDGTAIVGGVEYEYPDGEAVRWDNSAARGLGRFSPGPIYGTWATRVSADGSVVVGGSRAGVAVMWAGTGGPVVISSRMSHARGLSRDGRVIVGHGASGAVIWEESRGAELLKGVLENRYGLNMTGWELTEVAGISADGRTIIGTGRNPAGREVGWLAFLGRGCYADCDDNGTLDFLDFLCFQNAFLASDPYADCDENGILDFFDFLCFQNEFLAGCS